MAASLLVSSCVTTQGKSVPGLRILEPIAYDTVTTFKSPKGTGQVRRLRFEPGYDIQISPDYYGIPLKGVTRIDSALTTDNSGETAVIVKGASEDCANDHRVYVLSGENMRTYRVGNCRDAVNFSRRDDGGFTAIQGEGGEALVWAYQPRKGLLGPVTMASLQAPPAQPPAPIPKPAPVPSGKTPQPKAPTTASPRGDEPVKPERSEPRPTAPRIDMNKVDLPPVVEAKGEQVDVTVWKIRTQPKQ